MIGTINTSSNGYNSSSFDFAGNPVLFVVDHFGIKPL